ncbi:hypothetical protein [Xanthomonas vesicatoria]|uniref:Uncharacterized protein n=1 Tax=Xanthomonas vesicatoria ATCC 35937 TaxID=925775 RepID=F0BDN4_9XANT|nr:hypothetical protein [Xanthomonas vesicatoria]APP74482.1 hypothetical protein BJD12_03530 [Xanthomonas vesicatoria ATCC 35937]EGD09464.1 hypothetical protein XVE_2250 [Xanthomonas vesicatoria ATCC 35937]KTF32530.1 hypothetical protein LMG920_12735 [Xanthomonas vesicatoria]KTF38243.1 hypothetical protein LMG919_03725 [Xanthomonas vesicatoria]MCC8556762.1 hypothetical protein [Xanthomonas vesicatoria]
MSFSHKAFSFDWAAFERELAPKLKQALQLEDARPLEDFIEAHIDSVRDPYEGEPVTEDWRSMLEAGDVQELADFALTRYYQPSADFGIGEEWEALSREMPEAERAALLGSAFESFDPGRMGSYFQSERVAADSLRALRNSSGTAAERLKQGLSEAVDSGRGIYVTF